MAVMADSTFKFSTSTVMWNFLIGDLKNNSYVEGQLFRDFGQEQLM